MKLRSLFALSCCLALMGPAAAKAQDVFTFDGQPTNVNIPSPTLLVADNNAARTATFTASSPGGNSIAYQFQDNGPVASPNYGTNLSGVVLVDGSGTPVNDVLTLTFAQPITSLAFDYAISDFNNLTTVPADFLTLDLGGGNTATGGGTFNATSSNFEGTLTVAPGAGTFTTATITFAGSNNATSYALDNVTVTPAATAVPEPGTVAFALAMGLPVAWQMRRKLARK